MWVIPSWRVVAQMPKKQDGASALARSDFLSLTVSDTDLEAVLRTVKASGYEKVNGSAPDDAGCPSCGVGGGMHVGDCEQAVGLGVDRVAEVMREVREDLAAALEHDDNRTEEQ